MAVLVALIGLCFLRLDSCNDWMLLTMQIAVAREETNKKVSSQRIVFCVQNLHLTFFTGVYFVSLWNILLQFIRHLYL